MRPPVPTGPARLQGLLLSGALLLLPACVTTTLDEPTDLDGEVPGLQALIQAADGRGGTLRLVLVHGMGEHGPGYSWTLLRRLASRLGVQSQGDVVETALGLRDLDGILRTETFRGASGRPVLRTYEVTWSGAVAARKRELLDYDRQPRWADRRIWLNASLKSSFVNDRFADPLLYVGGWRESIQAPVKAGLQALLSDADPERDLLGGITMSLGSRILFDVLRGAAQASAGGDQAPRLPSGVEPGFRRLLARGVVVHMLANPLPLLELAAEPVEPGPQLPSLGRVHLVAINDPNDLLSYPLTRGFLDRFAHQGLEIEATNVGVHVERTTILGLVVNPLHAHTDHDSSAAVLDLMVQGTVSVLREPEERASGVPERGAHLAAPRHLEARPEEGAAGGPAPGP
jgi:hypothetical protein